ncbi:MAG: hypothetical protein JW795_19230 [Chitinivibrionales bacterium]|nr:hypothetical protein [Chitinivibrionales bacterium]
MAQHFTPPTQLQLYCRFCKKTVFAPLERCIAGSGKELDKESTFEYVCTHCRRPHCYYGRDILEECAMNLVNGQSTTALPRTYKISERFLVGEKIIHPSYKSIGIVVGKHPGMPTKLIVKFEKSIVSLVEGIHN